MSSLQVDSISSMGGGHVDGAGLVVQYVETSDDNSASNISTTTSSFVSTGITVSITPKFIGSKVCVDYTGSMGAVPANNNMDVTLFKDNVQAMGNFGLGYLSGGASDSSYGPLGGQYIFTTTSLSTIVFTVYFRKNSGGGDVTVCHNNASYTLSATEYAQ